MSFVFRTPSLAFRCQVAVIFAIIYLNAKNSGAAPDGNTKPDAGSLRSLSSTNVTADTKMLPSKMPFPKAGGMEMNSLRLLAAADSKAQPAAPVPAGLPDADAAKTTDAPKPDVAAAKPDVEKPAVDATPPSAPSGGSRRSRGGFGGGSSSEQPDTMIVDGDKVTLQFPNNTITDILGIYERLTNKTLVKDTNIFEGQTISLVTPQPVEKAEAVKLIEASMLTNGYAIVANPDGKSARILPTRTKDAKDLQFSQGLQFYQNAKDLPDNETIVSYFMKLDNLDPTQAGQLLGNHVGLNVYGRITPTTTPPGLLITESATIVRQLVAIKDVIDLPDTSNALITKFVILKYADAATVAQIIQATLDAQQQDKEQKGLTTIRGSGPVNASKSAAPATPAVAAPAAAASLAAHATALKKPQAKSQVVADARLNQLLIVAEPLDYTYVMSLITEFDKPVDVPEAYERQLKNVFSEDVIGVLADLLKDTAKGSTQLPGGGTLTANQQSLVSTNNSLLTGRSSAANQRGGSFASNTGSAASSATGSSASAGSSRPDQLVATQQDNSPIGVLVNKTRIIADPLANAIIVIGPKEDKDKVDQLLNILDRKPPQVYLSTVIGQLTLGKGMNLGVDYLQKFSKIGNKSGMTSSFLEGPNNIPTNKNVASVQNNAITSLIAPVAGLNMYGQITNALDTFVTALENQNDFKIISRPCVFALNNRKAVITSGQSIPVPTQSLTNATSVNANGLGNVTTTIDYKDVVLKLEVIPLINPDGEVTLNIAQVNDTVSGQQVVAQNSVPIISTEQLTTTVSVPSGNTVVLGGLISEQSTKTTNGIPVLSRIPGLGSLFKNDVSSKTRSELIIFIQPTVVNDNNQMHKASYGEDLRTDVGADAAKTFPSKVWPKAIPIENARPTAPHTGLRSIFQRPTTEN